MSIWRNNHSSLVVHAVALAVLAGFLGSCRATAVSGDGDTSSSTRDTTPADTGTADTGPNDTGSEDTYVPDTSPTDAADSADDDTSLDTSTDTTDAADTADTTTDTADAADGGIDCPAGEHDGGDGTCVPMGECADGFHDGGTGDCLPDHRCAVDYYLDESGSCAAVGSDVVQIDTSQTELWSTNQKGDYMAMGAEEKIFTLPYRVNRHDGTVTDLGVGDYVKFRRYSIWVSRGETQKLIGRYQGTGGYDLDGNKEWGCCGGCCDYFPKDAPSLRTHVGVGYQLRNGFISFSLHSGNKLQMDATGSGGAGFVLIDGTLLWGVTSGYVLLADSVTDETLWSKPIDTPTADAPLLASGALFFDGSLVTASRRGFVTRINPDATDAWSSNASISGFSSDDIRHIVVIGAQDTVYINTATPGITALAASDGSVKWERSLSSRVHDLVVGNRGYLYAYLPEEGKMLALDAATGDTKFEYSSVPGQTNRKDNEMMLRDGTMYLLGNGGITAVPVQSEHYDFSSSWPVRFHDNQRTSDLWGTLAY